jgi:hypothetical protein
MKPRCKRSATPSTFNLRGSHQSTLRPPVRLTLDKVVVRVVQVPLGRKQAPASTGGHVAKVDAGGCTVQLSAATECL